MVKMSHSLNRSTLLLFGSLFFIGSSAYLWVVVQSLKLRPIADDYCFAASTGAGILASTKNFWLTWSGDIVSIFISSAITGWPLVFLKWSVGSAIPFMLAAASLSLVVYRLVSELTSMSRNTKYMLAASVCAFVPIAWWSFWWITPLLAPRTHEILQLPNTITFWQTINSGYIVAMSISIVCFLAVDRVPRRFAFPLMSLAGLLAGLSGLVLACTLITLALCTLVWLFKNHPMETLRKKNYIAYIMGAVIGLLAAMLAPGTRARRDVLSQNPMIPDLDLLSLLEWTFPEALWEFMVAILGLGTVLVTLFFGAIGLILSPNIALSDFTKIKYRSAQLFVFALLLSLFSQISEAFSYPAFWHLVSIYAVIFLLTVYGSFFLGIRLGKGIQQRTRRFATVLLIATQVAMVLSILQMGDEIAKRYDTWSQGPAPLYQITDIESNPGWVWNCWKTIENFRELPDRS
jgi:hypothetical protein